MTSREQIAIKALESIFAVGAGYGANTRENPQATTGEGHAACRAIAEAALADIHALDPVASSPSAEREEIARTILVDVLGFKKPERAGQHNRDLANKAADIIAAMYEPKAECEPFIRVLASLAAAVSLLERAGKTAKKAAPSDKIFDQMLADYRAALEAGRAALRRTVAVSAEPVAWRYRYSEADVSWKLVYDDPRGSRQSREGWICEPLYASPAAPSPAVLAECLGAIDQLERAKYPQRFEEARATIRAALAQPATAGEKPDGK